MHVGTDLSAVLGDMGARIQDITCRAFSRQFVVRYQGEECPITFQTGTLDFLDAVFRLPAITTGEKWRGMPYHVSLAEGSQAPLVNQPPEFRLKIKDGYGWLRLHFPPKELTGHLLDFLNHVLPNFLFSLVTRLGKMWEAMRSKVACAQQGKAS